MIRIIIFIFCLPLISLADSSETENLKKEILFLKQRLAKLEKHLDHSLPKKESMQNIIIDKKNEIKSEVYPSVKVGGSISTEFASFMNTKNYDKFGANIRNARINAKGKVMEDLGYNLEVDFAKDKASLKKAYIEYSGLDKTNITVGRYNQEFGINAEDKFPEKHPIFTLVNYTNNGIKISRNENKFYSSMAVTTTNYGSVKGKDNNARTMFLRGIYMPILEDKSILHLGLSAAHHKPRTKNTKVKFAEGFETKFSNDAIATTEIDNINHLRSLGTDIGVIYGPFSAQAEFIETKLKKDNSSYFNKFRGGYLMTAYSLTGEQRKYNSKIGKFSNIEPFENFDLKSAGKGAWEVAFRYTVLDLNSRDIKGGRMANFSSSLNWYLNKNVNMMFSFIVGNTDKYAVVPHSKPRILLLRTNIYF